MVLFAHNGKMDAGAAVGFGWMMVALSGLLATALIVARIRSGQRPYLHGLVGAVPFGLLACWCFAFAAACRQGAAPPSLWRVVVLGYPLSLGVLLVLYRRWRDRRAAGGGR